MPVLMARSTWACVLATEFKDDMEMISSVVCKINNCNFHELHLAGVSLMPKLGITEAT